MACTTCTSSPTAVSRRLPPPSHSRAMSAQSHIPPTRSARAVPPPIHPARMVGLEHDPDDPSHIHVLRQGVRVPVAPFLAEHDIVVNCVLQNPDAPLTFVTDDCLAAFTPGSLIIDVSCDEGMGFTWARPTSFTSPKFTVGDNVHYYAVDHSPSLPWDSATWEISEALLPHLRTVLAGPAAWTADQTIRRAIEIREGVIHTPGILSFQHRSPRSPPAPR